MVEFSDAAMRKLSWELSFNAAQQVITNDDGSCEPSSFSFPEDPDERTLVPFYLSQKEYTAIASSVDVGSDIAYGVDALKVWFTFIRNWTCAVPICSMIIDCLETDADTRQAVFDALATMPEFNKFLDNKISGLTAGQVIEPLTVDECAPNILMGNIKAIIDRMDRTNTDFLEIVEVGTNDEEKLAALFELVPLLNQEPITDAIDFLQDILEDFAENYAAAITEERLLEIYCGIYCIAKDKPDCEVTYTDIFNYFNDRISAGLTLESLLTEIIGFVLTGDFNTDDLVVSGMFMLQAGLVRVGGELAGMSLASMKLATIDAVPSNLYLFCECFEPDNCDGGDFINFRITSASFIPYFDRAIYDGAGSDRGWGSNVPLSPARISVYRTMLPYPNKMRIHMSHDVGEIRIYNYNAGSISLRAADSSGVLQPDGTYLYEFPSFTAIANDTFIDCGGSSALTAGTRLLDVCWNWT